LSGISESASAVSAAQDTGPAGGAVSPWRYQGDPWLARRAGRIGVPHAILRVVGQTERIGSERDYYRRLLDLGSQQALGPLLEDALALAVEITGAEVAYLELHDDDRATPAFWRAHGLDTDRLDAVRASISRGIIARAIAAGETVETESAIDDDRFSDFRSVKSASIGAVLCVPIGTQPPIGVLYVQRRDDAGRFAAVDRERIELFARQLAPLADRLHAHDPARAEHDHTGDVRARFHCPEIVGRSEALAQVLHQAALVAPLDLDILITGPSGTGKTALARSIVVNSKRAAAPLVQLNCAALPDPLLESELYGAERGAHSTATRRAPGKVAAAEGGTLFLDEVAELSLTAQAKLLHLLQAREYHPLGATTAVKANIRVLAATNADLRARVAARQFRDDLYYRLHVLPIHVPGLAERRDDIPRLAEHICRAACERHGFAPVTLARRTLLACREAAWPGNIRELANALEAAVVRAHGDGSALVLAHHVFPAAASAAGSATAATFHEATRTFQRRYLRECLEANDWNVAETARQLDLARSHLYSLIGEHKLARDN
jgi:Nif-specific regulatory protein